MQLNVMHLLVWCYQSKVFVDIYLFMHLFYLWHILLRRPEILQQWELLHVPEPVLPQFWIP